MPKRRIADLVLESAIDYAIITMDLEGLITFWSKGAEAIFGWTEDEMIGRHAETFFTPEDRQNGIVDREMKDALQRGRGNDERWHLRKDHSRFWASGEMLPLHDGGPTEGFLKIIRDRTEQKKARELQTMLNGELSHRLKNQLGMVQSIVNQSLRRADDIEQARKAIGDRLGVLGRAHELLLTGYGERAAVRTVIEKSVNLREDRHTSQFSLIGPNLEVGPRAALSLALLLHELTTNAFKYGSLSLPEGLVEIRWTVADLGGEPVFQLSWQERNGPGVTAPTSMGFGSRLINSGISGATNKVETEYMPEGVRCTLQVSLSDFQSEN